MLYLPNYVVPDCRKLQPFVFVTLFSVLLYAYNVISQSPPQQQQSVVCASLFITNKQRSENELSGRVGCKYVLQNVILKDISYVDVTAINEKLSTIYSIDGILMIDSVTYSGPANVSLATIRFPQLAVIRGNEVKSRSPIILSGREHLYPSLFVRLFQTAGNPVSLALPALRVVARGDIVVALSLQFIYSKNINWNAFLTGEDSSQRVVIQPVSYPGACSKECSPTFNYCFGPGDGDCQLKAAGSYGCDSQCLGGCTGPSDPSKCFVCKDLKDIISDKCVGACPAPVDQRGQPRPDGRLTLGDTLCVKQCPPGLVRYGPSCMLRCPNSDGTYTYENNGECIPCLSSNNMPCVEAAGECYPEKLNVSNGLVIDDNAAGFSGCTKIIGDLVLYRNYVSSSNLRYLANITSVVGKVKIRNTALTDFDFLGHLKTIENRWQADSNAEGAADDAALLVGNNVRLDRLGLRSLQSVRGRITITNNPKLCVPPADLLRSQLLPLDFNGTTSTVIRLSGNKDASSPDCACSRKCKLSPSPDYTSQSCMAPNDATQCVACDTYKDASSRECLSAEQCAPPENRYISEKTTKVCSVCHEECLGCTGPSALDCSRCKNLKRTSNGECTSQCNDNEYLNMATNSCEPCHEGCTRGCFGPGNLLCSSRNAVQIPTAGCKPGCELILYAKDNASFYCQANSCPDGFFASVNFSVVQPAVEIISPSGCFARSGRASAASSLAKSSFCLPCSKNCAQCSSYGLCTKCTEGTLEQIVDFGDELPQSRVGTTELGVNCVSQCAPSYYPDFVNKVGRCRRCDDACATCTGPGPTNCTKCRLRVLEDQPISKSSTLAASKKWSCVAHCPNNKPITRVLCRNESDTTIAQGQCVWDQTDYNSSAIPAAVVGECVAPEFQRNMAAIVGGTVAAGLVVIIIIVVLIVVCQLRQRARDNKQTALVMQQLEPTAEPQGGATHVDSMASSFFGSSKPDMANLRLIAESSLKRGKVLGRGAFGTVFAGTWQPESGVRVPVALKVLRRRGPAGFTMVTESPTGTGHGITSTNEPVANGKDRASGASGTARSSSPGSNPIDDVINEARIMCSVSHPCCVRVVGLCLGQEDVVLVTQLMQFGSLLDLLLQEKLLFEQGANATAQNPRIGAWHFLTWAHQIADGMNYLESRGIIHRDLAARNVLVRNLTQVRITDFGLAKLLESQQRVYRPVPGGSGERLPFKWLALESLRLRVFTHKSDVWSYGVTLWEIFTFGEPPYGAGITPDKLISLLQDGNRLPQPPFASIDAYTPMIRCWISDPEERPSFAELREQFKAMAADPGRFLAIPGDTHFRQPNVAPVQPPSPNELLADLGITNQTYGEASAAAFSGVAASQEGRSLKGSESQRSKVVDVDDYLPSSGECTDVTSSPNQTRHSRLNHPPSSTNNNPSHSRNSSNMTPAQRLTWRNNGYTVDPTSQLRNSTTSQQSDGGVDGRNLLRVPPPQRMFPSVTASARVDSTINEDYLTPTNSSPSTAPLLPLPLTVPSSVAFYDGQRTSQQLPSSGRSSGHPPTSPISPTSSHRETMI